LGFWHLLQDGLDGVRIGHLMRPHDGQLVHVRGYAHARHAYHHRVGLGPWRMGACIEGVDPLRMRVALDAKKGRKGTPIGLRHGVGIGKCLEERSRHRARHVAKHPHGLGIILLETGGNLVAQACLRIDELAQVQAQTIEEPIVLGRRREWFSIVNLT
jgi:hypothetical protein